MCCLVDAFGGYLGYLRGSVTTTAPGEVRAAHSSRRDAVSKRIDQLAADVADLQRELARIKAERECACPTCAVGPLVRGQLAARGFGAVPPPSRMLRIASVEGSSND